MKLLAHNSQTLHGSPRSAPVRPAPDPIPTSRPLPTPASTTDSRLHTLAGPSSTSVPTSVNFNTSPSLHSICIRPASAAPAAFSDGFFERAPHPSVPLQAHTGARLRKSTSVIRPRIVGKHKRNLQHFTRKD
jgi:hypothetical protein